jgi:hypothetical protein
VCIKELMDNEPQCHAVANIVNGFNPIEVMNEEIIAKGLSGFDEH